MFVAFCSFVGLKPDKLYWVHCTDCRLFCCCCLEFDQQKSDSLNCQQMLKKLWLWEKFADLSPCNMMTLVRLQGAATLFQSHTRTNLSFHRWQEMTSTRQTADSQKTGRGKGATQKPVREALHLLCVVESER